VKNYIIKCLLIIGLGNLLSCTSNETIYNCNGIEIKRIDTPGKSRFYYYAGDSLITGLIYSRYSGINDGFDGYLEFRGEGKVQILVGDGYFISEDVDSTLFSYKYISTIDVPRVDSVTCIISFPIEKEIRNLENKKSGVSITYN